MMLARRRTLAGLLALLAGCVEYEHNSETSGPETGGETGVPTTGGDGDGTTEVTTGGDPVDGVCNQWDQDCPAGNKCAPVDTDADGIHDGSKCVPLAESPKQPGDECHVEGSPASGVDDCDLGVLCWGVNPAGEGVCIQMCGGTESAPTCPNDLLCDISNSGALRLCVQPCDPLTPSCPEGKVCITGSDNMFVCDTDASGDGGAFGDQCEYINVCNDGLFCASSASVPGCNTPGCCTEFCDLDAMTNECSGQGQVCEPFYEPGTAPPGNEDIGGCTLPM